MELITDHIRRQLRHNAGSGDDHVPVVKLFDPHGPSTWLLTQLADDGDMLFGLCDIGYGCPELGSVSLELIKKHKGVLGFAMERDINFKGRAPLQVYVQAALRCGRIVESGPEFEYELLQYRKTNPDCPFFAEED